MENVQALLAIELFGSLGEPQPALHSEQKVRARHTGEAFCIPHGFVNIGEAAPSH
jgi:hypothetical protein